MPQNQEYSVLKGAQYAEEPNMSQDHVQSFLIPIESIQGFVFGTIICQGAIESFQVFESIIHTHLERLSQTVEEQTNLAHRFEQLLQALNEDVSNAFHQGQFSLPIADSSSIIGVANEKTVIVSGFGNLFAQFLHKTEKERYEIYDLSKGMRVEEEVPSWKKPFLTVLDGDLKPGDVLYIGSKLSRHDLSISTFNEVLTTLPPNSALSKIRQYLPNETVFTAVVLKIERSDEPIVSSDKTAAVSLSHLQKTTETTDQFLSEQKPDMRSVMLKIWRIVFPKNRSEDRKKLIRRLGKFIARLIVVFLVVSGQIIIGLATTIFKTTKLVVTNPKRIISGSKQAKDKFDRAIKESIGRFNRLSSTSKYILLGLFAIAFIFSGSVLLLDKQQERQMERLNYDNAVKAVEKKIDNAEASLIYDEEQAKALLNDAALLAEKLPVNTKDRQETAEQLKAEIKTQQNTLRHLITVETTKIADASTLPENTNLAGMTLFNGALYLISDAADAFGVNQDQANYTIVPTTKQDVNGPKAMTTTDNAILWLDAASGSSETGLTRYTPSDNTISALSVSRDGVDLATYASRLYILSPTTGQIYRHSTTVGGYDGGSAWVISGVSSLTDATALTIDGYVWVLKADGKIIRFLSGKEGDWQSGIVEPPLLNAKDIWTSDTSSNLYVLDSTEKRIVVLEKDSGNLVQQFTNEAFSDLKAMSVDEASKLIYVLAGNTVYKFGY